MLSCDLNLSLMSVKGSPTYSNERDGRCKKRSIDVPIEWRKCK